MTDVQQSQPSHTSDGPLRVVVVGGGIGGAEVALTLAIGLPDAEVTLVGQWPSIRLLPDLVYVPFGISPRRFEVPLDDLVPHGVRPIVASVEGIDVRNRTVATTAGPIEFDVLVASPGAQARDGAGSGLRTLDDALRIREQFAAVIDRARAGERQLVTIRSSSDDAWTAPACELALLMGAWVRAMRLDDQVDILLAAADNDAFEWFGPMGEVAVEAALRRAKVHVATNVPAPRFDELGGHLVVDFGPLEARRVDGLPGLGPDGWYEPSRTFEVARRVFVVGDAIKLPYRAGFATAWQARHVLRTLGGDPGRLGLFVDGVPTDSVEYQMDLADGVLHARIESARMLACPFLGHDAEIEVSPGARPDKLAGLLLYDRVLQWHREVHDAPLAFRDALREAA